MSKTNRPKAILDTSAIIEAIKYPEFRQLITSKSGNTDIYTLYYVMYELKTGLIISFIDFYNTVRAYNDISRAKIVWSEHIGRKLKNAHILEALIAKYADSIQYKDVDDYLSKIEATILAVTETINTLILDLRGSFADNKVAKYELFSNESYAEFQSLSKTDLPNLKQFWSQHEAQLSSLIKDETLNTSKYEKMYKALIKINNEISKADAARTRNQIGDAIIAVDTPSRYRIITIDNIYLEFSKLITISVEHLNKIRPTAT